GVFSLPDFDEIEEAIRENKPGALLVIPYDNPTGQCYGRDLMAALAGLCVRYGLWMISDEAYRELYYQGSAAVSIWDLTNHDVPGIEGRRISIESSSKVWNACGLRIGALVTDSEEFHRRSVAEYTANLCPNAIGQYIFGALAHESRQDLHGWYGRQRDYYQELMTRLTGELISSLPGIIVSIPAASIYSVVDVREITRPGFSALDFVLFCARRGKVPLKEGDFTLLVAPMSGFYEGGPVGTERTGEESSENPGLTQMRIAYVEPPEQMNRVPHLFKELLTRFERQR
ncbi:hypothetical protein LCGC14_2506760, partial [marine sediment metagenome]